MIRRALTIFVFLIVWATVPRAWAGPTSECRATGDEEITCGVERYRLLRDKSRVGQLVCEALETGMLDQTLPSELLAVCESASLTSRVWAQAETMQEHRAAAREAQRAANTAEGALGEARRQVARLESRVEVLAGERAAAERATRVWKIIGGVAVGWAVGATVWLVVE